MERVTRQIDPTTAVPSLGATRSRLTLGVAAALIYLGFALLPVCLELVTPQLLNLSPTAIRITLGVSSHTSDIPVTPPTPGNNDYWVDDLGARWIDDAGTFWAGVA